LRQRASGLPHDFGPVQASRPKSPPRPSPVFVGRGGDDPPPVCRPIGKLSCLVPRHDCKGGDDPLAVWPKRPNVPVLVPRPGPVTPWLEVTAPPKPARPGCFPCLRYPLDHPAPLPATPPGVARCSRSRRLRHVGWSIPIFTSGWANSTQRLLAATRLVPPRLTTARLLCNTCRGPSGGTRPSPASSPCPRPSRL
jgi:hypothetical protein